MNKQSAFVNEESDEEIVKDNVEETLKELKRRKNCERQRAFYHRQKDLRKNEQKIKKERKKKETLPKSNAERQRTFRQRKAEKSYVDMRTQKLDSNEENVPQFRAVENIENVTLQENHIHSPQLQTYENECTPEVLHRNTGIPGDVTDDTIENKIMKDVEEQTESQTNDKIEKTNTSEVLNENIRNRNTNELDKFKRRMIRAIARLLYTENKAEADIWDDLKNETGCDCELLWSRMRALTIKKLLRLFTAEDKIKNITKIVQLSVTDWLLYDLVLVHEKVDVIGQELDNKEEPAFLRDLFNLVEEFNIESATGGDLIEKWFEATAKYNNTGKRQCSPMLLQKRWYQLKERSRSNFYNFWFQYRGDSKKLERANEFKPSDLQLDIVKRFKEIVTKPFLNWEVLVKEGRVALPEDFERLRMARNKFTISENEPDIEVIEQHVETIDLEDANDSNDSVNKDVYNSENDFNIDIVKVESLADQDDDVSVLESVHIPLEKSESSEINNSDVDVENVECPDDNDLEIIESDSEQIMPKIASVTSTAYLESSKDDIPKESAEEMISIKYCETQSKSGEAVNSILEHIFKNVENKINTRLDDKNGTTSKAMILNLDKEIELLRSNVISDSDIGKFKNTDFQGNDKNSAITKELSNDIGFDDFSNHLNFIDDGIEFVDDGIEYMDEDCISEYKVKSEIKSEIFEAPKEEEPKIDLKLLLTPVVYTKKLDDMDVFRFIDYNIVRDVRVLQNAARESKPVDKKSINMKTMFQECKQDDAGSVESDSGEVVPNYDVAISSWLFRKPKVNNYNPIQLCKNPDFNTRLKRLAAAFYTSQRNRLLLKECKPLTVDLHKTFESRLVNNTLYLIKTKSDSDCEITVNEIIAKSCKTELPDTMEPSTDNKNIADQQNGSQQLSEIHIERNKVIHLPDIEQIRRVNQGLLVAEVSPIQVTNPVNQANIKPPNNLLDTVIEPEATVLESEAIVIEPEATVVEPEATPMTFTAAGAENINTKNSSQFALETDKVISVYDSDNSKLTDSVNVHIEQSETMSQLVKNYKKHTTKALLKESVPKSKTKTYTKKYMQLSWLPKPQTIRTDVTDCLLAADTVERILSLCKDDYVSPKLRKPKRKKKARITDQNTTEKLVPAITKRNTIKENKNEKETQIRKKSKCRISITTQTTNIKNVCCWSRQKVDNFTKLNTGKHYCLHNRCVCCCKADLEAKILAIEEQRKRSELIIVSDDESITITSAQKPPPISKVTIGTNTDYDKDFEDQFAANLSIFKDNANQAHTPIISLPLNDLPQNFSNESGCQTLAGNIVVKPLAPAIYDNKITHVTSTPLNKPKVPIGLGKNKILLCSFKSTTGTARAQKIQKCNQNSQPEQVLPKGCHLVLLPNRELALSIDPGVELDANQLSKLPSLIAAVQKEINVLPSPENILESQKNTLNEDTVIHLSDDENSSIIDDSKNNFNVSSMSNTSPTAMHMDSSNANTVTGAGANTKDENQTPSIVLNSLSMPKESCNIPEVVTANNSTNIDTGDVLEESSENEITSKDNNNISGEVIDNSTNNAEDGAGVNKKTILSDLMEMSGISTDDIVSNNDGNVASNEGSASNNVNSAINNESISLIQQMSQSDSSTSDPQSVYANISKTAGINPIMDNIVVRAAILRCPELNIVSSFPELKYAYENRAQFFKMDVSTGIIVPINVCIKQDLDQVRKQLRKRISKVPKSVIDLTEDNEIATYASNIPQIQPKMSKHEPSESCEETPEGIIQPDKNNSPVKPIKMFKAIHPSLLRYSGRSLMVKPIKDSTVLQNKIVRLTKHKRKQEFYIKNTDLDRYNVLKIQNNVTKKIDSDAESDEEPLAKKAKRLKGNLEKGLDVDSDVNSKESVTTDINDELPSQLEPMVFEHNTGQSSDDDCILGF